MNLEISLSEAQLAGRLPVYIKGKRYWLVGEKTRQRLIGLKKLQVENLELLEQAKILALKRKDKSS